MQSSTYNVVLSCLLFTSVDCDNMWYVAGLRDIRHASFDLSNSMLYLDIAVHTEDIQLVNTEKNDSLPSLRRDTSSGAGSTDKELRKNKQRNGAGGSDFTSAAIRNSQRDRERDKAAGKKRRNGSLTLAPTQENEVTSAHTVVPQAVTRDKSSSSTSSGSSTSGSIVSSAGSSSGSGNGNGGDDRAAAWWEHRNIR